MTLATGFTLLLVAVAVALFVSERLRVDLVGMLLIAVLLVSGILEPAEALAGFSNAATVTIAAMFVLSAGLLRTGGGHVLGILLARGLEARPLLGLAALMVSVGAVSAFINNTAAVAILLPIILGVGRQIGTSPSRLLMPLSFASMFGGVCTLIGTSTNLLASELAAQHGYEPFGMFEMAPLGLVFFAVGIVYMLTLGRRLVPDRPEPADLADRFAMTDYLADVTVAEGSAVAGSSIAGAEPIRRLDLDILAVQRGPRRTVLPNPGFVLAEGDVLRVRASLATLQQLGVESADLVLGAARPEGDPAEESGDIRLLEIVITPDSRLSGSTLERSRFRNVYDATVLAMRHRGQVLHESLKDTTLVPGDTLLLDVKTERLDQLRAARDFQVISEVETERPSGRLAIAAVILAAVVGSAAVGLAPIVVSSVAGVVAMLLTGCLRLEEAYEAVDWRIIFLLAGVLGLGMALEKTGGAELIARGLLGPLSGFGPIVLISAFYLLTSLLTETMSNSATVVLLAPVAMVTAEGLGADPRSFLFAVTFAASASFMTPVGYQTNTLIYGPGRYRFADFLRVGLPLNVIFWLLATALLPVLFPLFPDA